jgi:Ser-tRNA(Ala) deacylase AlaX
VLYLCKGEEMELLYYKDAYLKECKSIILESYEEDEKYYVKLDNNIFYAQGGG